MKENPLSYYKNDERVAQLVDCLEGKKNVFCKGITGSAKAFVVAAAFEKVGGQHFVVCPDKENAAYFYNDLENIFGEHLHSVEDRGAATRVNVRKKDDNRVVS